MIKTLHEVDFPLLIIVLVLLCFGLVMVYSSSASFFYFKKQFMWAVLSAVFFFLFAVTDYKNLQKFIVPVTVATIALLICVLIFGKQIRGARRWFDFHYFYFQPSELAKFVTVLFMANYLDKNKSRLRYFTKGFLPPLIYIAAVAGLIAVEPDLGIPAIIGLVAIFLYFIGGARVSHILLTGVLCAPLMVYAINANAFRLGRLMSFLDPWKDAQGTSYQLIQSLVSLGSGGVLGKGAGASDVARFYLPDAHTDFIFAVIGEEFGIWGGLLVVLLFCLFMQRGYVISRNARDSFGMYLAAGITLTIALQAFFNIAVCTGCVPTKGITLPFVSYGGSSLLLAVCATGVLANISATGRKVVKLR